MTDREKAREIAEETLGELATSFLGWINECSEMFCEISAEKMAEWKDRMFDSAIIHFYHLIQDGISFEKAYKQVMGREWNAPQTEERVLQNPQEQ